MTEQAPEQQHGAEVTRGEFTHLASMVQSIIDRLPLTQQQAQEHTERHLDRPSSVEEQTLAAVRQLRADEEAKAERSEAKTHREATDTRLAKLEEQPPAEAKTWRHKLHGI